MADWIPIETDFIITGKDAEGLAASPDPGVWLKTYMQKKCNLPHIAKIDPSAGSHATKHSCASRRGTDRHLTMEDRESFSPQMRCW